MKAAELRKMIGLEVQWSSWAGLRRGIVEDVRGRNVLINGDWKWIPDLVGLKRAAAATDGGSTK